MTRRRIDLTCLVPARLTPEQIGESLALLDESAAWLRARGIQGQWPQSFTSPATTDVKRDRPAELRRYAEAGQLWVLRDDGYRAVATAAVTHWADQDFAHHWPGGHADLFDARYLCRMASARDVAGQGVGAAMIDFAEWLARCAGVSKLRLDCSKTNTALHDYYRRQGFEQVGLVDLEWRLSGALFERPICVRAGAACA
jgi:GNAT superfamily N-acetyltransferase